MARNIPPKRPPMASIFWRQSEARASISLVRCSMAYAACPEASRRAVLGDLFEQIVKRIESERQLGKEVEHVGSRIARGLNVGDGIARGKRHILIRGRAGPADVVARDGNRVPLGH